MAGTVVQVASANTIDNKEKDSTSQIKYVENKGQWHPNVLYKAKIVGQDIFLENDGFTFLFFDQKQLDAAMHGHPEKKGQKSCSHAHGPKPDKLDYHAMNIKFLNSTGSPQIIAENVQPETFNFFIGNNPDKWGTKIHPAKKIIYQNLYEGIDLHTYSNKYNFKYDVVVAPNADISQLALKYEGQDAICVKNEELYITTSLHEAIELAPYAYQIINGQRVTVACKYRLEGNSLSFDFPEGYNANYQLIIDPELAGSTYGGSFGSVYGHSAAPGQNGEIVGAGRSFDSNYPVTTGAFQEMVANFSTDICVSFFNEDASALIYSTFLGGSGLDLVCNLLTNSNNELIVLGGTSSTDYPVTPDAFQPAFGGSNDMLISILSTDGSSLVGSSYLGGSGDEGMGGYNVVTSGYYGPENSGLRGETMVDDLNNVYIANYSSSSNFPTTPGVYQPDKLGPGFDGIIAKFNPNLSTLEWATYIGGTSDDVTFGVRVDSDYNVYGVGATASANFPTTAGVLAETYNGGNNDGFAVKLSSDGASLLQSTFIGTSGDDATYLLEFDRYYNLHIYGVTDNGSGYPVTPSTYSEANGIIHIAALNEDFSDYEFSTVFGDAGVGGFGMQYSPSALTVDYCSKIYLGGFTDYSGFPTTSDAWAANDLGGGDFYFAVLEKGATGVIYGTYFGDSGWEHVDGGTCRFDQKGAVYQAVCTSSTAFPTTPNATFSTPNNGGSWDLAVFKFDFEQPAVLALAGAAPAAIGCSPLTVNFENNSQEASYYYWDMAGLDILTEAAPVYTFEDPGLYEVMFIAIDSTTCNIADTTFLIITCINSDVGDATFVATPPENCTNTFVEFDGPDGEFNIQWLFGDGGFATNVDPTHAYPGPGDYEVTLTVWDDFGCFVPDTTTQIITIPAEEYVTAAAAADAVDGCAPFTVNFTNTSTNATSYEWDFGNNETSTDELPTVTYNEPGNYTIQMVAVNPDTCNERDSISIDLVVRGSIESLLTPPDDGCAPHSISVRSDATTPELYWDFGDGNLVAGTSATYDYTIPGLHEILAIAVDSTSCNVADTVSHTVEVFAQATAFFATSPVNTVEAGEELIITNTSTNAETYEWDFGDGNTSTEANPKHTYAAFGTYEICLQARNAGGCDDDICEPINVTESAKIGVPNSFTPNGDNVNDELFISGNENIEVLEFRVYNRWGQVVFETTNPADTWQGEFKELDQEMEVYVYTLVAILFNGEQVKMQGNITLLR